MMTLLWTGILLLMGYMGAWLCERFAMPKISAYLLIGMALSFTGVLPESYLESSSTVIGFALAVIAFMIGSTLQFSRIKKLAGSIVTIMFFASETTFAVLFLGLSLLLPFFYTFEQSVWQIALFMGAIGAATAPAAVLAVIHQYRAKGPLTSTLLGVVAMDDAVALFNFSVAIAFSAFFFTGGTLTWYEAVADTALVLLLSVACGALAGGLHALHLRHNGHDNGELVLLFGALALLYAGAEHYALDALLVCMVYGMTLINLSEKIISTLTRIQLHYEELLFILFFILSGAHLDLGMIERFWSAALLYVVLRLFGKVGGSYIGAKLSGSDGTIGHYIGLAQMPQAGVAIGLALALFHHPQYGDIGAIVFNTIIIATAVNEIIGPLMLKYVLIKAGEAENA